MKTKPDMQEFDALLKIERASMRVCATRLLCLLITLFCSLQSATVNAQSQLPSAATGERITDQWLVETEQETTGMVRLTLTRRTARGGTHESSWDIPLEQLRGLTVERMNASDAGVQFKIGRDAGTFYCEGVFNRGSGSGRFTFAPSSIYLTEMRKLGYENFSDEEIFALAVHDVSLRFIGELDALGYSSLYVNHLVAMRIHGVTSDFIIDLKTLGYDFISVDRLVAMRIHKVTVEFIKELQSLGYFRVPIEQLVAMKIHGVTASFIEEMRGRGYRRLSVEELIRMKIHGFGEVG
ncbi:MAG TPA: hypothetical protein VK619_15840 [Pyrinomonadaceae bacterium]|nr:hypothetical protein [Pyrinomonadaceae bacterium]